MSMETNLHGRLHNTSLPASNGLLPLFEAVVNSIHSIEEAGIASNSGRICVRIIRDAQQSLELKDETKKGGSEPTEVIAGFKITDNGVGFNDVNMTSFRTLDGEHKADKGGRGVGRLLWLKAFKRVNIASVFKNENGEAKSRSFVFNATVGVTDEKLEETALDLKNLTTVYLDGFGKRYQEASYKTVPSIANSLFEHCLWYFVRAGGAPQIVVEDGDDTVRLDDVYENHMVSSAVPETILIKDHEFYLTHIKLRATSSRAHAIAMCAANRLVKEENLSGKIPGLYGKLKDDSSEFVYMCYVGSEFLDKNVRSERTEFDISEEANELFAATEISLNDIRDAVVARASAQLAKYLAENKERSKERVEAFVSRKAPRYRPILSRIPEDQLSVDPNITDKDLDLVLHKHLSNFETQILADGHDLMQPKVDEGENEYTERLREYLVRVDDIKKSDLANYVSHRKVIIDLLEKAIQRSDAGNYAREEVIHQLIMPMRKDSTEIALGDANLWLIDERLAFHDYLASDKTLTSMPITGSEESRAPDLCCLKVLDTPTFFAERDRPPFASLTVIEIKRPMRNDAGEGEGKDPIEQCLGYLQRIRNGKVKTTKGRSLGSPENIPGYCYVICDLTSTMKGRCEMHDLTHTSDGLGYFGYKTAFHAFIEVISFDQLVNMSKERNRAFFERLGLPT